MHTGRIRALQRGRWAHSEAARRSKGTSVPQDCVVGMCRCCKERGRVQRKRLLVLSGVALRDYTGGIKAVTSSTEGSRSCMRTSGLKRPMETAASGSEEIFNGVIQPRQGIGKHSFGITSTGGQSITLLFLVKSTNLHSFARG
jgi:hypothetical protein